MESVLAALRITPYMSLPVRATLEAGKRRRVVEEDQSSSRTTGNGLGANVAPTGRDITLYGLPHQVTEASLKEYLKKLRLVPTRLDGRAACFLYKVEGYVSVFSLHCSYDNHVILL